MYSAATVLGSGRWQALASGVAGVVLDGRQEVADQARALCERRRVMVVVPVGGHVRPGSLIQVSQRAGGQVFAPALEP